jgi:hypothetical protein
MFILFILRLELQSPLHRVIAGIRIEDNFKETDRNKELFNLTNNDRDTRHLMILVVYLQFRTFYGFRLAVETPLT